MPKYIVSVTFFAKNGLLFPCFSIEWKYRTRMEENIMPRRIDDSCIACGACQAECPVDCIYEGDIYRIDEDVCIDCGACEAVCPVDAISEV